MQDLKKLPTFDFYYQPYGRYISRERYWSIYSITNQSNGKVYVGRTTNPRARAMQHFAAIRRKDHSNITDFDDDFIFEILDNKLHWDVASDRELYFMKIYRSYDQRYGYNTKDTHFYQKGNPTKNYKEVIKCQSQH